MNSVWRKDFYAPYGDETAMYQRTDHGSQDSLGMPHFWVYSPYEQ